MDSDQNQNNGRLIKKDIKLIYICSFLIAILVAIGAIVSLVDRTQVYPIEELVEAFLPNDVVNLFVGLPILLGSMGLSWRGKMIGPLFWTGALFFMIYNYLIYLFSLPLSWIFLLYMILVVLSLYTLIYLLVSIDGKLVREKLEGAVPEKLGGGVLVGLGVLFFFQVLGTIAGALANGEGIIESDMAVHLTDFIIIPSWIICGILLWRGHEFGYVTSLGLLFQASMLFIALVIFLLFQPVLTNAPFAAVDTIVVSVMGLICFVPFGFFVRGAMGRSD